MKPSEPKPLTAVGKLISDTTVRVLTSVRITHGKQVADEFAAGYVDGTSRYWAGDEDESEICMAKQLDRILSHTIN